MYERSLALELKPKLCFHSYALFTEPSQGMTTVIELSL